MGNHLETQRLLSAADEEIRRRAVQFLRGHVLKESYPLLFLAMADDNWRVRKEAVEVFVESNPDDALIGELLELFRNEDNAGLRNSAAEAIARLGDRAVEPLIRMAGDSDADVRKFVIDTMGAIASPRFFPALRAALKDMDVNVAAAAAEQLGDIGDRMAVPELINSLIANTSQLFRFSALAALGKLEAHITVPDEIFALTGEDILRKGVYVCLGSIGDESACRILLEGFQVSQKSSRAAAVVSWYRIYLRATEGVRHGLESAVRRLSGSELVLRLIELFPAAELRLGEALIALLGMIGDLRAIPTLLQACEEEQYVALALTSLKRLGDAGLHALVAHYPQADDTSRAVICTLVGEQLYRPGSAVIRGGVHDPSPAVRSAAVRAAALLGMTECIYAIAGLYAGAGRDMRMIVRTSLLALADADRDTVLAVTRQLAESVQPGDRRESAMLYAALGDGVQLFLLAKDEDALVRQAAIYGLGTLKRAEHSDLIQIALADEAPEVRIAAADALGALGSHDLLEALIAALSDTDVWVKCAVLRNIDHIDRGRLFPLLDALFARADGILMLTCLELLDKIGSPPAMVLVATALAHHDADVVEAAAALLERREREGSA